MTTVHFSKMQATQLGFSCEGRKVGAGGRNEGFGGFALGLSPWPPRKAGHLFDFDTYFGGREVTNLFVFFVGIAQVNMFWVSAFLGLTNLPVLFCVGNQQVPIFFRVCPPVFFFFWGGWGGYGLCCCLWEAQTKPLLPLRERRLHRFGLRLFVANITWLSDPLP